MTGVKRRHARYRKRLRQGWRRWGWITLAVLAIVTVLLGYVGYRAYFEDAGVGGSRGDALYRTIQLFALEGGAVDPVPWQLEIARVLAPLVTALAVVNAIVAIFHEQLQTLKLRRMRGHAVVCGLGTRGLRLAERFSERGEVAAIERNPQAEGMERCRDEGIVVLIGDATDSALLAQTRPRSARYLIIVGDDDRSNAEVAARARELAVNRPAGRLEVFVHVADVRLCSLLRERERAAGGSDSFGLRFFNVFETGARAWLQEHPPFGEDGDAVKGAPRLIVAGVGQMGKSLVIGAVRDWLSLQVETGTRPRITLIDRQASRERDWLWLEHPRLDQFCDLDAVDVDVTTPTFDQGAFLFDSEGRCDATTIYVCFDDDALSLETALSLHQRLGGNEVPIVVRMKEHRGLAALLDRRSEATQAFANLHVFHLLESTCTPEFLLGETAGERLAKAIHAEYMRDQERSGKTPETNPAMVSWDELPEGLRESNRRQADHDRVKLAAVGCVAKAPGDPELEPAELSDDEIEMMTRMEHDRWMAERLFEGWTYAPGEKTLEAKTSPYLVPWEELSEEVKGYDRNTVRALPQHFEAAGLRIYRLPGAGRDTGNGVGMGVGAPPVVSRIDRGLVR